VSKDHDLLVRIETILIDINRRLTDLEKNNRRKR
jgi:hypothetical protein